MKKLKKRLTEPGRKRIRWTNRNKDTLLAALSYPEWVRDNLVHGQSCGANYFGFSIGIWPPPCTEGCEETTKQVVLKLQAIEERFLEIKARIKEEP